MSDQVDKSRPPLLLKLPLRADKSVCRTLMVHDGKVVVGTSGESFRTVGTFFDDGRGGWIAAALADSGKWGYINERGEWLIAPALDEARAFSDDGMARFRQDGRWGFVNRLAQVVIAPQFEDVTSMCAGVAGVQTGRHVWRIIDSDGKFTSDSTFLRLFPFGTNGLACASAPIGKREWRFGFVDRTGAWRIPPRFETLGNFGNYDVVPVSEGSGLYGLLDAQGHWVLEPVYRRIDAFNDEGFAYFRKEQDLDSGKPGFMDVRGREVFHGDRDMGQSMSCGIVKKSHDGTSYLRSDGTELDTPFLSFGESFRATGCFAVVRTTSFGGVVPRWGLLHENGHFVPAPDDLQEPLTDADNWIAGALSGTPLVPFLSGHGHQQLAWLDRDGMVRFRADYADGHVTLTDSVGAPLWRSGSAEGECLPPEPFFDRPLTSFLRHMDSEQDLLPLAQRLLSQVEERLHALAEGTEDPDAAGSEYADEDEDEDYDDELDEESSDRKATTLSCRIMRCYVGEENNGTYEFVAHVQSALVERTRQQFLHILSDQLGKPDPDPEHVLEPVYLAEHLVGWHQSMGRALPGDTGVLKESRDLWLSLYTLTDSGDGDMWSELYLCAAPSVDALKAAQAARRQLDGTQRATEDDGAGREDLANDDDSVIAHMRARPMGLADLPRERMTDAIVQAALEADEDAIRYVPRRLMTPQRYALALKTRDKSFEQIPDDMMSEDACVEHVRENGYRLENLPVDLRSLNVCVAAVHDRSAAIQYVPEELHEPVRAAVQALKRADHEEGDSGAFSSGGSVQTALENRITESWTRPSDSGGGVKRAGDKLAIWALILNASVFGKAHKKPRTMGGVAGTLEQRPGLLLLLHALFGVCALVLHAVVTVAVWRSEGMWYGLATAILMGYSEVYWAWRFLFTTPQSLGLGVACVAVFLYTFVWRYLYVRVLKTYAPKAGGMDSGD